MKVYCHKCGGIHEKGICPLSHKTPNVIIPQTSYDNPNDSNFGKKSKRLSEMNEEERIIQQFYNSKEWRKKRQDIIKRARGMCEVCWALGKIKEGREVHHIVKLRTNFDLRLNDDNLVLVCVECHKDIENRCQNIGDLISYIEKKRNKKK